MTPCKCFAVDVFLRAVKSFDTRRYKMFGLSHTIILSGQTPDNKS